METVYDNDIYYAKNGYKRQTTPLKAIKDYCKYQCCVEDYDAWRNCTCTCCPLYMFRLGKNPYKKFNISEEQKAVQIERLKNLREAKKIQDNLIK